MASPPGPDILHPKPITPVVLLDFSCFISTLVDHTSQLRGPSALPMPCGSPYLTYNLLINNQPF